MDITLILASPISKGGSNLHCNIESHQHSGQQMVYKVLSFLLDFIYIIIYIYIYTYIYIYVYRESHWIGIIMIYNVGMHI